MIAGSSPAGDLVHEDVGEHFAGERMVPGAMPGEIDHDGDAAHHDRKLAEAELGELLGRTRHIRGAEVGAAVLHAHRAGERADRLVVERRLRSADRRAPRRRSHSRRRPRPSGVAARPARDDRVREGRARARELRVADHVLRAGGARQRRKRCRDSESAARNLMESHPLLGRDRHRAAETRASRAAAVAPARSATRSDAPRRCARSGRTHARRCRAA